MNFLIFVITNRMGFHRMPPPQARGQPMMVGMQPSPVPVSGELFFIFKTKRFSSNIVYLVILSSHPFKIDFRFN